MLYLSGFELYYRWVPLAPDVVLSSVIRSIERAP